MVAIEIKYSDALDEATSTPPLLGPVGSRFCRARVRLHWRLLNCARNPAGASIESRVLFQTTKDLSKISWNHGSLQGFVLVTAKHSTLIPNSGIFKAGVVLLMPTMTTASSA
jgi:hypothetical protein